MRQNRRTMSTGSILALAIMLVALGVACDDSSGGFTRGEDLSISVTPEQISFGAVTIGQTDRRQVTITHDGSEGTLELSDIRLVTASDNFSLEFPEKTELGPDESTVLTLVYEPTDAGEDSGHIAISHNARGADNPAVVQFTALVQIAQLYFTPSPLQFGDIKAGEHRDLDVQLINGGADTTEVVAFTWVPGSSDDFGIMSAPSLPVSLAPGEDMSLSIRYEPSGGDTDLGELIAHYRDDEEQAEPHHVTLRMFGQEIVPRMVVSPGAVDFSWVALEEKVDREFTISNDGNDTLYLDPLHFETSHAAISLEGAPDETIEIEPDAFITITVVFEALDPFPMTTDPIAKIAIPSNDPRNELVLLPVFGRIKAPSIRVTPAADDAGDRLLDFGIIAQNLTAWRDVVILNAGYADLEVTDLIIRHGTGALDDEFTIKEDSAFPPSTAAGGVGVIEPNQAVTVTLGFTNLGPDTGEAWGSLSIHSNDDTNPEVLVNLRGSRDGAPRCEVVFEPGQVNYGTVAHGFSKEMTIRLRNIGSGYCSYLSARLSDCPASLFPGFGSACNLGSSSSEFAVVRAPLPVQEGLAPGGSEEFTIRFTPPDRPPMMAEFNEYGALLQVTMINPYGPPGEDNSFRYPADDSGSGGGGFPGFPGGGGGAPPPNLVGRSGVARVSVMPDQIDFGLVTLGCVSETRRVSVYNSGSAEVTVTSVEPGPDCGPEFLIDVPPIPTGGYIVTTGDPLHVEVRYYPQEVKRSCCSLVIRSTDRAAPTITVPMCGEGTLETDVTDTFTQTSGQEVDVLMVIDDSGSMCNLQDRLTANINEFINQAQEWENDYHIGVTLCCITQDDRRCKVPGGLITEHEPRRWVTPDNWSELFDNASPGCSGDPIEAGLEAAFMALTLPNTHLGDPCGSDRDCRAPDTCLPDLQRCGGRNAGFMRQDAALEIIMFSDEEDQSPAPPDFYVDFFKSIKGYANENFMHVHAIVGDKDTGCSLDDGSAQYGNRYIYVAEQTGGIFASICSHDFAEAMTEIGGMAFGLKVQFFLSRAADPATIEISVNGTPCPTGWLYDPNSNSVIFDEGGSCMPQEGDEIKIEYEAICFTL